MKILAAQRLRATITANVENLRIGDYAVDTDGRLVKIASNPNSRLVTVSKSGGGRDMARPERLFPTDFAFTSSVRSKLQKEILRKTHRDFIGSDGVSILVNRKGGTTLVPVTQLTDSEIFDSIAIYPKKV